jgi:hypothetical protein
MHEREKDAAEIDVLAATMNAEAARIVALAEARARSAQDCRLISGHGNTIELAQALAKHERDEQLAHDMAMHAGRVRDEAAELQRLARDMRRSEAYVG